MSQMQQNKFKFLIYPVATNMLPKYTLSSQCIVNKVVQGVNVCANSDIC